MLWIRAMKHITMLYEPELVMMGAALLSQLTIEDPRDGGWGLRRMDPKEMVNPCDPSDQADTGAARRNL
jgi:hypothetical protein